MLRTFSRDHGYCRANTTIDWLNEEVRQSYCACGRGYFSYFAKQKSDVEVLGGAHLDEKKSSFCSFVVILETFRKHDYECDKNVTNFIFYNEKQKFFNL